MLLLNRPDSLSPKTWRLFCLLIVVACRLVGIAGIPRLPSPEEDLRTPTLQVKQFEDFPETREREQYSGNRVRNRRGNEDTPEEKRISESEDTGPESVVSQDDQALRAAPQYMLELYRKFSNDKYSHPIANIVRSFKNINTGAPPVWTNGNNTRIALQTLLFNISSINADEEIYLAELRLYTSKKTQRILVYEVVSPLPDTPSDTHTPPPPPPPLRYHLLTSRDISPGSQSDWETFTVTEVIRRWVKTQASGGHILEVRVDTARPSSGVPQGGDKPEVTGDQHTSETGSEELDAFEPILVVFSNDRKKRKIELRELHEIQTHENEARPEEGTGNKNDYFPPSKSSSSSSSSSSVSTSYPSSMEEEEDDDDEEDEADDDNSEADYDVEAESTDSLSARDRHNRVRVNSTAPYRRSVRSVPEAEAGAEAPGAGRAKRTAKAGRRRRDRKNSCRRKPMYVDFRDVKWENWIIEPSGYQAYECTGQCYFPLGDKLTPTKYAMVKSLLHATYPKRASAVCCVPTRLEPISLLYLDEQGIVTYKYKYDGMVVAECGCR